MYRDQFETTMKVFGKEETVTVKVRHNGWGEVFNGEGYYVGSLNPIKMRRDL